MPSTVERLEELLEVKDRTIAEFEEKVDDLSRQLEWGVDWMLHETVKPHNVADDPLPAPRIEYKVTRNEFRSVESTVYLVLNERGGSRSRIPLGQSRRTGSTLETEQYPTKGILPDAYVSNLPSIINDACYYIEQTGLPGYVVLDETHLYKIDSLRPLVLSAI